MKKFLSEFKEFALRGNVLDIGTFLTTIIDFILVALVIFIMIKAINRFHKKKEEAPAPEEPKGPTSEELLTEIRDLLKEKNQ